MSLTIYTGALDAIYKLESKEQKRLQDFVKKFKQDPTSAAIHLEPISTFKDPYLRTARISQKYRAVLRAPEVGDVYTLMWVDNHDEAYRWAANKQIEWNVNTDSYQIFSVPEEGDAPGSPAPVRPTPAGKAPNEASPGASGAFAAHDDLKLLALGIPQPLLPSVRAVHTDADLDNLYDYLPIESLESLSMLLEGVDYDTLLTSIQAGKSDATDREAQQQSANNRNQFVLVEDDEQLELMLSGDLAKWQIYLHREQRSIVELQAKGPIKVSGGAGTGKTVAALHRAAWLQEHGEATASQPILFTTFTKALRRNLAKTFGPMRLQPDLVKLNNIDSLAAELYQQHFGKPAKVLDYQGRGRREELWQEVLDDQAETVTHSVEFLMREYASIVLQHDITDAAAYYRVPRAGRGRGMARRERMAVWRLIEGYREKKAARGYLDKWELMNELATYFEAQPVRPYRHVIVDELQDFSNAELRLIRALAPEASNDLFLVGDPFQRIYGGRVVFSQVGIHIRGSRSRRLLLNYRTTENIRRYAVGIVNGETYADFDDGVETLDGYRSLRVGEAPTYQTFYSESEEADHLVAQVARSLRETPQLTPSDIVIAFLTRGQAKVVRKALHDADYGIYDVAESTGEEQSGVHVSTLHALKGLEYKVVLIGGISARTWPGQLRDVEADSPEAEAYRRERLSLLYVAVTRAILVAGVSGVGEPAAGLG